MKNGYEIRYIKTKNKIRKIVTYSEEDKYYRDYHEKVVSFLHTHTFPSKFAKAYLPGTSIVTNAKAHMYNDIFIKLDIHDYFHSINHDLLSKCLYFEINKQVRISYRECCKIVRECSISDKGIPLGLVSSPALANLYLKQFDGMLYGYIKTLGLNNPIYTRYADDMIISFKAKNIDDQITNNIIDHVIKYLRVFHLTLNEKKTKIVNLNRSNHVRITGICIVKNEHNYRHLSVGNKLKNELFWKLIEIYDHPENYTQIEKSQVKGMLSFVLSVEKTGLEDTYSERMKQLLRDRGFDYLAEIAKAIN